MNHLRKFNESTDENVELIKDIITDFLDEFNIKSIDVDGVYMSNGSLSQVIFKMEKIIISPAFIRSIRENDEYHRQFMGSPNYDKDVNLIKKYLKYKAISATIRFYDSREKIISKINNCLEVIKSYGFIPTILEKYGGNSRMILLEFVYE